MGERASIGGAGQQANAQGSGHTIVQIVGDDARVILNGAVGLRLETYIQQAEPTVSPEKAGSAGYTQTGLRETGILSPYNRKSLHFRGRDAELDGLWAWMTAQAARSAHIVIGTGGRGKTRLAVELAATARAAGWTAGFAPNKALEVFEAQGCRWHWDQPTLLIIDYAAAQYKPLATALRALVTTSPNAAPLRILLLERYGAPSSTWWQKLFGGGDALAEEVGELLSPAAPLRLEPLGADARFAVFEQAFQTATPTPAPERSPPWDETLARLSLGGDPLFLAMAGLVLARQGVGALAGLTADQLAFKLAEQELQRIEKHWRAAGLPLVGEASLPAHLTAFATLCGGLSAESAHRVIAEESAALHQAIPANATAAAFAALHSALPDATGGIAPIQPDILGEAIVIQAFDRLPDGGIAALARAVAIAQTSVFQTIIRTCQDFLIRGEKRPLRWLQALKAGAEADFMSLVELSDAMPLETLELREIAAEMAETIVDYCRVLPIPNNILILASSLNNLSTCLTALGRREAALAAGREATDLCRALAAAHPDAFTPNLAMVLSTLSNSLANLGRQEEALAAIQEAVDLYDTLAVEHPEAFTPDLAMVLNNLSTCLAALGQREEALVAGQRALDLRSALASAHPAAFTPNLAMALSNISNRLAALGRREEALAAVREAVELYRALAAERPDAFMPDLAMTLNNLSVHFADLGQREAALAAVQDSTGLYRTLTAALPEAFTSDLAMALNNLSTCLADLDRQEAALAAGQEAIKLYRALAAARPDAFTLDLARALNNLSNSLSALRHREAALAVVQEVVELYRALAAARPDAFTPALASALNNLSNRLSDLGQRDDALAVVQEAVNLYRALAAARPNVFAPELARALGVTAHTLTALDRPTEAITVTHEAISLLAPFFYKHPPAFAGLMEALVRDYLTPCDRLNLPPDDALLVPILARLQSLTPEPPHDA